MLVKDNWKNAWASPDFRKHFIVTLSILVLMVAFIDHFFYYIQSRDGHPLRDVVLDWLPADDVSNYIFASLYIGVIIAMGSALRYPEALLTGLQAYGYLTLMRMCTLYFIPLEPHPAIVSLEDPFIGYLFYDKIEITKDLFFSGHVSTICLLVITAPGRNLRIFLILDTILLAGLMLVQHAHYTVDILAAPLFAAFSVYLAGKRTQTVIPSAIGKESVNE
ncbi:phosphatase PAP2-related protein [Chryseolinea lacunae]|uniref:Sphingomyelin synthase-like domain-containing protein n=1 Tax=Chryseolinea lacunae TaxID=2801331 RepID=A0ABS1L0V4_9BACT|nr:phosphatase PAP2-related protein [Chryseolinea lacunae]MBL0745334.1 hypothetical protein [Chryseolinea lacunae]